MGEEAWEAIRRGNVVRPGRRENEYGRGDGMGDGERDWLMKRDSRLRPVRGP